MALATGGALGVAGAAQPGHHRRVENEGRGHSLMIDNAWREVADTALAFIQRFA